MPPNHRAWGREHVLFSGENILFDKVTQRAAEGLAHRFQSWTSALIIFWGQFLFENMPHPWSELYQYVGSVSYMMTHLSGLSLVLLYKSHSFAESDRWLDNMSMINKLEAYLKIIREDGLSLELYN